MAGLSFDITADASSFNERIRQVQQGVEQTARLLEQVGKNFDTSTVEAKVLSLNKVIRDNESVMAGMQAKITAYQQTLNEAAASGDTGLFDAVAKDMQEQKAALDELTRETEEYKAALSTIETASGMTATQPTVQATQLYTDQGQYERVVELRAEIEALQQQMAAFDGSPEGLIGMQSSLTAMQDELRAAETAASETAASLGEDLGGKAAEVSERLYELNDSVATQAAVVADLEQKTQAAREALDALQGSEDTAAVEKASSDYESLATSLQNARNGLLNLQAQQRDAQEAWGQMNNEINTHNSLLVKMLGGTENYNAMLSRLPGPIRNVVSGITGMTGAARLFIATPLGATIGAIVLALQTVKTWMDSSVEGQLALAEASGYLNGILGQLKEVVITVGKAIYTAFTDPKKAVTELWRFIQSQFTNRIQALGGVVSEFGQLLVAAFSLDTGSIKEHLSELGNQYAQLLTGVEDAGEKMSSWARNTREAAEATAEISRGTREIELEYSRWQVQAAQIRTQMAALRNEMSKTTISAEQRAKATEEYKALNDRLYDTEADFLDRKIAMQERSMSLTSNSIEDEQKLADLEREREEIETRRQQSLKATVRVENSLGRAGGGSSGADGEGAEDVGAEEAEKLKARVEAMREYLREYGDFQAQRQAIAEEYAERIAEAETPGEKLSLQAQQAEALADVDRRQSEAGMGQVGQQLSVIGLTDSLYSLTESQTAAIAEYLQEYLGSEKAQELTDADRQQLQNILDTLNDYVGGDLKSAFRAAGQAADDYQAAMQRRNAAEQAAEQAAQNLALAQQNLASATTDDSVTQADMDWVEEATEANSAAQEKLQTSTDAAALALERMQTTAGNASDSFSSLIEGLQGLKSGSLSGIFSGVDKIASIFGANLSGGLSDALSGLFGKDSALGSLEDMDEKIISLALSVLDILADGLDSLILDLVDTVLSAVEGVVSTITNILSGDFFVSLGESLYEGVGGILDTLTFGGLSSWFSSSNAAWVQEVTDRLTDSNEALTSAVQELTEEIEDSAGIAAQEAAAEATEDQEQIIEQTMEILQTQMRYHSAHHSNAYYWDDYFTGEDYEELNAALAAYAEKYGTAVSEAWSLSDIYELTPEEFNYIRTYYADVWDAMVSAGKYDKSEYWEAYADLAGDLEEIEESLQESLTQTTFDSLYDSFVDTLMDMDAEAEDFADDFSEYMMQAMLSSSISNFLGDDLQDFYDTWSEYMNENEDASLTEAQLSELRDWWDEMVDEGLEIRDSLAAITGYDSSSAYSQEASTSAWESMSEETAEELNGRFTALQIAGETVATQAALAQESMQTLVALTSAEQETAGEMRNLMITSNSYLEDILKYTRLAYNDFGTKFDDMVSQLNKL